MNQSPLLSLPQNIKRKHPVIPLKKTPSHQKKLLSNQNIKRKLHVIPLKITLSHPKKTIKSGKKCAKPVKNSGKSKQSIHTNINSSPQQGLSHINLIASDVLSSEDESESQMADKDICCVCKKFYARPVDVHKIAMTNWAQCDICGHWVHLVYCTPVRVVRKETPFKCPCC